MSAFGIQFELGPTDAPIDAIRPNPLNPRGEVSESDVADLVESVKSVGILQRLTITRDGLIVAGHRRYYAARLAGLAVVPVDVRDVDASTQIVMMLVENLAREDLTPSQEARAYSRLLGDGQSKQGISRACGVSLGRIELRLRILSLSKTIQASVDDGSFPISCVIDLLRVPSVERREQLARLCVVKVLAASQFKKLVNSELAEPTDGSASALQEQKVKPPKPNPAPKRTAPTYGDVLKVKTYLGGIDHLRLGQLMERACDACGQQDHPSICGACPLATLARWVGEREHRYELRRATAAAEEAA